MKKEQIINKLVYSNDSLIYTINNISLSNLTNEKKLYQLINTQSIIFYFNDKMCKSCIERVAKCIHKTSVDNLKEFYIIAEISDSKNIDYIFNYIENRNKYYFTTEQFRAENHLLTMPSLIITKKNKIQTIFFANTVSEDPILNFLNFIKDKDNFSN